MAYKNLSEVIIQEEDQSLISGITSPAPYGATVITHLWGPEEWTLVSNVDFLVDTYLGIYGNPEIGDSNFLALYKAVSKGFPFYVKRCVSSDTYSANVKIVKSDAVGGNTFENALKYSDPVFTFASDELFGLYTYSGSTGNKYAIKIPSTKIDADNKTFVIEFYLKNGSSYSYIKEVTFSRIKGSKSPDGEDLYLELAIENIGLPFFAKDNLLLENTVLPKASDTYIDLQGGDNGSTITDVDIVASWETAKNEDSPFNYLFTFGLSAVDIASELVDVISFRRFNKAFIDVLGDYDDCLAFRDSFAVSNGRCYLFAEEFKSTDIFNRTYFWEPPTSIVASIITNSYADSPYKTIASPRRGSFTAIERRYKFTEVEMDNLLGVQINPLGKYKTYYTLIDELSCLTYKTKLGRLYARVTLDAIEEGAYNFLDGVRMEKNTEELRTMVQDSLQKDLDYMVSIGALEYGKCKCDGDNNPASVINDNKLMVYIYVIIPGIAKTIVLKVVSLPSGVNVEES